MKLTETQRALLGDREAQEAITARGELLPCHCGGKMIVTFDPDGVEDSQGRRWAWTAVCEKCCATTGLCYSKEMAIESHNTRAPLLAPVQLALLGKAAWISVKDWLPENEKDVLIAYTRKGLRGDVYSCVGMAFHTDGKTNTDDSVYSWQTEYIDMDYDEESDAYIIPEGWWETVDFGEEFSAVDMVVTHWMPLPEPPEEG